MRGFARLFVFVLLVGGWLLAGSALHVVRTQGQPQWLGKVLFVPKDHLGFKETYVDMRHWTPADVAGHPLVVNRLAELNMNDVVMKAITATNDQTLPTSVTTSTHDVAHRDTSIFGSGQ